MSSHALVLGLAVLSLSSCTIYLKDAVEGPPYHRAYKKAYNEAVSEGLNHDAAHRRALLAGSTHHHVVRDRRRRKEAEDREWDEMMDEDPPDLSIGWD